MMYVAYFKRLVTKDRYAYI